MKPLIERRRRSAREVFSQCRARYKGEYLDGLSSDSLVARRGSTFHKAREHYIRELWRTQQAADFELAAAALAQALIELPIPYAEEQDVRDLWARWTERFELPLQQFVAVETDKLTAFSTVLRYDLVLVPSPDTLLIDDAKTSYQVPSEDALEHGFQANFYLTAARLLFPGFLRYAMRFDYIRHNAQITVELTASELDVCEAAILTQDAAMALAESTQTFPATGGAHCGYCTIDCPLVDHAAYQRSRCNSDTDAMLVADEIAALSQGIAQRREALRSYADQHGPIESSGVRWAHWPQAKTTYPAQAVIAVLDQAKTPYALTLSLTAVKPLVTSKKKYAHVAEAIKALGTTLTFTTFGAKQTALLEDLAEDGDATVG